MRGVAGGLGEEHRGWSDNEVMDSTPYTNKNNS